MQNVHSSPVAGWLWPTWWQEGPDPSPYEMAKELATLDAESPEHWEALFYGLLDLPEQELVQLYFCRL
jgi:hypothetical protein